MRRDWILPSVVITTTAIVCMLAANIWWSGRPANTHRLTIFMLEEGPLGLDVGTEVGIGGAIIGSVVKTEVHEKHVVVEADVDEDKVKQFLGPDSIALIRRKLSGLGGTFLDITVSDPADLTPGQLNDGTVKDLNAHQLNLATASQDLLPGLLAPDPMDQVQSLVPQVRDALDGIQGIASTANSTLETVRFTVDEARQRLAEYKTLRAPITNTIARVQQFVTDLDTGWKEFFDHKTRQSTAAPNPK